MQPTFSHHALPGKVGLVADLNCTAFRGRTTRPFALTARKFASLQHLKKAKAVSGPSYTFVVEQRNRRCNPQLEMTEPNQPRFVVLPSGRRLAYAEYGDPRGVPVLHFNGSGGSRLDRPSDENMLQCLGIRFISTDRPGHGLSDPVTDRRLLDWPVDVCAVADELMIDRFFVEGWSAGVLML